MNPVYFLLFYATIYMGNAVFGNYFPVYLDAKGFSQAEIGVLLSIGPIAAMIGQPIWGIVGDKTRARNRVLQVLLIGSGAAMLLVPVSDAFLYILIMIGLFTLFQSSIFPMSDAVTLEELDRRKSWNFGIIRLGGTIGFAVMSAAFGTLVGDRVEAMFATYAGIMLAGLLLSIRFPAGSSASAAAPRTAGGYGSLFRNARLMLYLGYSFSIQATLGFYYSFFPIYLTQLGGDNALIGWSMFISSLAELPFLLFSGRILQRIPIGAVLACAGVAAGLRWLLFSQIDDPYWILPVQALHGCIFIVLTVAMATYINRTVAPEWKASGQALHGLISFGAARITGSLIGGLICEAIGIRDTFLICSAFALLCTIGFGLIAWKTGRNPNASPS
jgi:PPP family 3-phenylpropionic acid transporter